NQTNTCPPLPAVLAPGASCGVSVTFSPTGLGAVSGTLTITDNGVGGPHTVALSGRGSYWSGWSRMAASMTSAPAVSTWGTNRLDVFARGQDNALYHTWYDGTWHYWSRIPANMTSAPTAVSWGLNRIDVFARGSDNDLYSRTYDPTNGWQYWVRLGGNLASAPAVSTWGVNRLDVFALGQDLAAYHLWSTDGGATWNYWDRLDGSMSS